MYFFVNPMSFFALEGWFCITSTLSEEYDLPFCSHLYLELHFLSIVGVELLKFCLETFVVVYFASHSILEDDGLAELKL